MNILIVAATNYEISGLIQQLEKSGEKLSFFEYSFNGHHIFPMVLGVGSFMTGFGLGKYKFDTIDVAIQIGIAGAFTKSLEIGEVVLVSSDIFADLGVSNADGSFSSVYDLQLWDGNKFPLSNNTIFAINKKISTNLKTVSGLTVNRVTGSKSEINEMLSRFPNADVESMEGAAFLYACIANNVNCLQLRAISNYVEPRNKENWNIDLALDNLEKEIINMLNSN